MQHFIFQQYLLRAARKEAKGVEHKINQLTPFTNWEEKLDNRGKVVMKKGQMQKKNQERGKRKRKSEGDKGNGKKCKKGKMEFA